MKEYFHKCHEWFNNSQAHFQNSSAQRNTFYRDECDEVFDGNDVADHEFEVHGYCPDCKCYFGDDLDEHNVDVHGYCPNCNEDFGNDLVDHNVKAHNLCIHCNKFFENLKQHWRDSPCHFYCLDCDRLFKNEISLNTHLNSSIHRSQTFPCPGCNTSFTTISALDLHLKARICRGGITKRIINKRMRDVERHGIITRPDLAPQHRVRFWPPPPETWASQQSYNPDIAAYECPLPHCSRTFRYLVSVNQHLQSSYHEQKEYHCPHKECEGLRFARLSSLVQHLESHKCGVGQWRKVNKPKGAVQNRKPPL